MVTPAQASFHLMKIREIHPDSAQADYIELQMTEVGQNLIAGQTLTTYMANGMAFDSLTFPSNVAFSESQRTILVSTGDPIGVTPDFAIGPNILSGAGAVCFSNIDCVSYGNFLGAALLPSPTGSPAAPGGLSFGQTLERSIAGGCPTLLEQADDTNDSATDFALSTPSPRNNSTTPTEKECDSKGPVQTLTAKKKQDVDKVAVYERLDEAGTVTMTGKVKVPSTSARIQNFRLTARIVKTKKSTKSLAANAKTKIKIKLSQSAKKKVKAAIEDSGPRKITVTAIAKDALGNSTTKKIRFKVID